jgi:hypothetical protein
MSYLIILDTNVVFGDFFFKSADMKKLLKYTSRESIDLCITKFNYYEIIKKYSDEIRPLIKIIKNQKKNMSRLDIFDLVDQSKLSSQFHIDEYKKKLDEIIEINGIQIIDFPSSKNVTEKISKKYFSNEKPFDVNKPSFQDAIMWESLVEYCELSKPDVVAFVSDNHKDFSTRERKTIHEHLKSDIDNLIYFSSLSLLFDNQENNMKDYFIDSYQYDEDLIEDGLYYLMISDDSLQSIIDELLSNTTFSGDYLEGWGSYGHIDETQIEVTNVTLDIEDNSLLISFDTNVSVSFEIETNNPMYERGDFGDGMLREDSTAEILVQSDVTYSLENNTFTDFINLNTQLIGHEIYTI